MIFLVFGILVTLSIVLLLYSFKGEDPQAKAVRERLMAEMTDENTDAPRGRFVTLLQPLVGLNARFRLYRKKTLVDETLLAGKVAISAAEFFALKELGAVGGGLVYLAVNAAKFHPLWFVGSIGLGWLLPDFWLKQKQTSRHRTLARDLPEVVDLLALCVEAGADFMVAVQRVVREYRPCPMRDELGTVLQEIRIGKRRREAFKSMAQRVRMPDVTAFCRAVIHADRMGTGMATAMRIMSEDTRMRRYHQAERFAQQAPLKMLIPLVMIMMCALIMVAGPVLLQFTRGDLIPKF